MMRHTLRFAFFLAVLAGIALLATTLLERQEPISVQWNGWVLETHLWVAALALAILTVGSWLVIALLIGVFRAPDRVRQAWRARRRERGVLALGQAFAAYAAEDGRTALANARRAERLLGDSRVTRSVVAKSLEMSGKDREANEYFAALAANRATAETGERGLLAAARKSGDADSAVAHARKVIALHPDDAAAHRALVDQLGRSRRWADAREALKDAVRRRAIPRDECSRLEACAWAAEAVAELDAGNPARAAECAQRSAELDPAHATAAGLAARLLGRDGKSTRAERLLLAAWRSAPAPEIAAAWSDLRPRSENADAARKHMLRLTDSNPAHPESRLIAAEAAVTAQDWDAARSALGDLPATDPTARVCAAMAAIEKVANGNTAAAQVWLARALDARTVSQWSCGNCGCLPGRWEAICPECGGFASVARRRPLRAEGRADASSIAPLIDAPRNTAGQDADASSATETSSRWVDMPLEEKREPFYRPDA